jgi:hypothetical protein
MLIALWQERKTQKAIADVAQSVEHLIGNEEVGSSNLLISSKDHLLGGLFLCPMDFAHFSRSHSGRSITCQDTSLL